METATKFRIYPTDEQKLQIKQNCGCCRFLYNHFLEERSRQYEETGKAPSKLDQMKELPALKEEYPWLKDADSTSLQRTADNLEAAYNNFFRRVKAGETPGYPKFKRKHAPQQSYTSKNVNRKDKETSEILHSSIEVGAGAVKLPKLGWVECRVSKVVHGRILSATITRTNTDKYYVSLQWTDVSIPQMPKTGKSLGIDLGLKASVTTSDGDAFPAHRFLRDMEKKLKKEQRKLARKTRGSRRWEKQRLKVARLHEKIKNQRQDTIHKMTTELVRDYDVICAESLQVKNMMRNHCLAKAIADAGWGEIVRQLRYKAAWYGKTFVQIDRFFPSSQLCPICGYRNELMKNLGIRQWECPICGAENDRDVAAAMNILEEGLRLLR